MFNAGDWVKLKQPWADAVEAGGAYPTQSIGPVLVREFTMRFGQPGAIDVGTGERQEWCWVDNFEPANPATGPW